MSSAHTNTPAIAIAGAGRMGRGIAIAFALAGYRVHVIDLKPRPQSQYDTLRADALTEIGATLESLKEVGLLQTGQPEAMAEQVQFYHRDSDESSAVLAESMMVFEAVPETLDAKRDALQMLSQQAAPELIIASTTSTILSNDLQALVTQPQRFLNAHWLNPAFLVPLVELSPASATTPETVQSTKQLLQSIGKIPIVCKPSPGYIVPRIQMLAMNEAARLVEEGVASVDDIDKATKYGFGFRFAILGMLEFIDWGGGDILYHAGNYMSEATGEQRFAAPDIVQSNMRDGRIGLRSGQGFLDYDKLDVAAYQRDRLAAFVALLKHLDLLPARQDPS